MSETTLAVAIGNSRMTMAVMLGNVVLSKYACPTAELNRFRREPVQPALIGLESVDRILISSVVPDAVPISKELLRALLPNIEARVITHEIVPMASEYDPPESLGIDRLLSGFAAYTMFGKRERRPILVVDLGTATTLNCISADGVFLGGVITLGVLSTLRALGEQTAQLPEEAFEIPDSVLANSTSSAIRSGVFFSAILGIRGLASLLSEQAFAGETPIVVNTGGMANKLQEYLQPGALTDPDLLLKGIALLPG